MLIQRVRDAERDLIFNEYKDRKGELIRGIVRRFEKGNNIIVDLGRTEGVLPVREQTPRETYRPGDRIVAYVKDIDREARGPQIILSRTDSGAGREALRVRGPRDLRGHRDASSPWPASRARARRSRSSSRDADVDPVGACVGMKGSRVQAVVQELRGEKIDIVPCDRDPARFVMHAIQPAEVHKVIVDEADGAHGARRSRREALARHRPQGPERAPRLAAHRLEARHHQRVEVQADGRGGDQRARCASRASTRPSAKAMYRLGFRALEEVAEASEQELGGIPGLGGVGNAERIKNAAVEAIEVHASGEPGGVARSTWPSSPIVSACCWCEA